MPEPRVAAGWVVEPLRNDHNRTVVDAIDSRAANFYRHFGFVPFPTVTNRLFLPMRAVADLFR